MDVEILFPEINLFPDQMKFINPMKPPIISRSRRRRLNKRAKLRTRKKEVIDEVVVDQRSDALPSDEGFFGSDRPGDATALVTANKRITLADSHAMVSLPEKKRRSASLNLVGCPYNLRHQQ